MMATRLVLTAGQPAESICRLCFTERRNHELTFIGSQLQQWIEQLTAVKIVHVPSAPASICTVCRNTLEGYEKFREMCHNNDQTFQDTYLRSGDSQPKRQKVAVQKRVGSGSKPAHQTTVELDVVPCGCSGGGGYEAAVDDPEIKIEEVALEKPDVDPLNAKIVTENDLSREMVIDTLRGDLACQRLIRDKLVYGASVANKEKSLICRTLCAQLFTTMIEQGIPISSEVKIKLAQCIVAAYPCLGTQGNGVPPEADWFWKHAGQSKGEHTGKIQVWIRNAQTRAPASVRRKRRGTNLNLTDDEANAIEELSLADDQADYRKVNQLMVTTFAYRQNLRGPKTGPSHLCAEFPQLLWYGPLMIEEEFDRMYPNRSGIGTLSSITSFCLMLNHAYDEIACETVQALMKVMAELTLQGNIRKESSSGLSPVEEYASIFIRWQQPDTDLDYFVENVPGDPPYIVCSALPFSEGQYFAVIMNSAIDCGFSFGRAFDVLLKSYKVFNFPVSGRAKKVLELFDLIYGIQGHSRLCNVNKLFEKISKAASRLLN